jgi:hypothetical protein
MENGDGPFVAVEAISTTELLLLVLAPEQVQRLDHTSRIPGE